MELTIGMGLTHWAVGMVGAIILVIIAVTWMTYERTESDDHDAPPGMIDVIWPHAWHGVGAICGVMLIVSSISWIFTWPDLARQIWGALAILSTGAFTLMCIVEATIGADRKYWGTATASAVICALTTWNTLQPPL